METTELDNNDVPAKPKKDTNIRKPIKLGCRLKLAREAAGKSPEDIAAQLNLAVQRIEEIENDSPLIALGEILPFCEEMTVEMKGKTYWLDDQYCIKPHCDCQEAAITFLPIEHSSESAPKKVPTIMLAYNKNHWSTLGLAM